MKYSDILAFSIGGLLLALFGGTSVGVWFGMTCSAVFWVWSQKR